MIAKAAVDAQEGGGSRITLVLGNDDDGKAVLSARLKSMGTATKISDLSSAGYGDADADAD